MSFACKGCHNEAIGPDFVWCGACLAQRPEPHTGGVLGPIGFPSLPKPRLLFAVKDGELRLGIGLLYPAPEQAAPAPSPSPFGGVGSFPFRPVSLVVTTCDFCACPLSSGFTDEGETWGQMLANIRGQGWALGVVDGRVVAAVCPRCQTGESEGA